MFLAKKSSLHIYLEVKVLFTPTPMIFFHSARTVKDYLVRAKLYPLKPDERSKKFNKSRCEVYSNIESKELVFSTVIGETFKINHCFNCDSKCLLYLIICRPCKLQFTGQTFEVFQKRWNNYSCCVRKSERGEECNQKYL